MPESIFRLWALCFCILATVVKCKLVKEQLNITLEWGAPDGQGRWLIKTNGQFPSPTLVFDEDDDVEITVNNNLATNTTVHWHGLPQMGTPWSDGTPGLSQKPIQPGKSFIYRFKASPAGTYWYHSHSRATVLDGLYGALIIHRKPGSSTPWHMISNSTSDINAMRKAASNPLPYMISDWSRYNSSQYLDAEVASGYSIFCVDSILLNGRGSVYCPSQQYLIDQTSALMVTSLGDFNGTVNDKGCFPFNFATEGPWAPTGNASRIPAGLQSGCVPSQGSTDVIEVDPSDKWISLNFVCAASFKAIKASIDQHPMWVYEVDGQYIEPKLVDTIQMFTGERYAVLIKLDQKPGNYTIRIADQSLSQVISAFGIFSYKRGKEIGPSIPFIDYGGQDLWYNGSRIWNTYIKGSSLSVYATNVTNVTTLNKLTGIPPFPPNAPAFPTTADQMQVFYLEQMNNAWQYTMNNESSLPIDWDTYHPFLYYPNDTVSNSNLVMKTLNGSWVDLVLQVAYSGLRPDEFPHLIHKHSTKTWWIGVGQGIWNYSSVTEAVAAQPENFNLVNPPYRDTFLTDFDGPMWIVLRYQVVNPGAWLFHCHFEMHLAGGMGFVILDGVDRWPMIPPEYGVNSSGYALDG